MPGKRYVLSGKKRENFIWNNKKRTASLSSIKYSMLFWAVLFNK